MAWMSFAWIAVAALAVGAWVIYFNRTVNRMVGLLKKTQRFVERIDGKEAKDAPLEANSSIDHAGPAISPSPAPLVEPVPRRIIHDLNNLVGTITGFADAALEDLPSPNPVREDLQEILEAAVRAKDVILQLNVYAPKSSKNDLKAGALPFASRSEELSFKEPRRPSASEISSPGSKGTASRSNSWVVSNAGTVPRGTEHLLIVDDEITLLRMLSRFFEKLGYRVTAFSRSVEAFEAFQNTSEVYDLVILDQRMPEMSGASLATEMLKIRPGLPVVVLSGYTDSLNPADAARIGIRRLLSKPIPQPELGVTIRELLDDPSGAR